MSQKDEERQQTLPACQNSEKALWLMVENAVLDPKVLSKKTQADSIETCRFKCNLITNAGRNCPAFTYNDVDQQCTLYTNDSPIVQNLLYKRSISTDFSTRTATKFCYPGNIEVFKNCTEIIAFHDFTLNVVPREEFDGMPKGKEGLHACIELCILSPYYFCKSATFLSNKGLCRLNEENSLSSPENFLEVTGQEQIYFENTCSQYHIGQSGKE
uniref:PAN domain protein n=1 Tax=Syphacia muris TaxID=451379 RepID=A0A0N5AYU3_9BILA